MTVDLRKDAKALRALLDQRVRAYAAKAQRSAKVPPVSAIEVGYCFDQSGWMHVNFDVRPEHKRDGSWTRFKARDLLDRPHWAKAIDAILDGKPVTLVLPDGKQRKGKLTENAFSTALGRMIKGVLLEAKTDGALDALPKRAGCQLDIEEFNGSWAWPEFEKLGKVNVV